MDILLIIIIDKKEFSRVISFLHSHVSYKRHLLDSNSTKKKEKLIIYCLMPVMWRFMAGVKEKMILLCRPSEHSAMILEWTLVSISALCLWWSKSGKRTADYRENLLTFQIFNYSCSSTAATKWNTAAIKILLGFWAEEIFAMEFNESWIYSLLQQSTGKVLTSITCFQQLHPMWAWVIFTSFVSFWFCG